jgi:hypothetical protein
MLKIATLVESDSNTDSTRIIDDGDGRSDSDNGYDDIINDDWLRWCCH